MRVGFGFGFTAIVECIIHLVFLLNYTLKGNNNKTHEDLNYDIFIRDDLLVKPEDYLNGGSSVFCDLLSNMSKKELKKIRKSLSKRLKRQCRKLQKKRIHDEKEKKKADKKKARLTRFITTLIDAIIGKINYLRVPNGVFNSILEYDEEFECYLLPENTPYSRETLYYVDFLWKQYQTHMKNLYILLDLSNGTSTFLTSNIDVNRQIIDIAESPKKLEGYRRLCGFESFLKKKMDFIFTLIGNYIHGQHYDYYYDDDYYDDEFLCKKIFVNGEWISANVEYKMFSPQIKKKIDSLILFHMQVLVNNIDKYNLYCIR